MKKLFLIFFFSMIGITEASLSFNFTRCAYLGDPTCLPGQTPPAASFAGIAGGYLAVVANGQFVDGYVAVTDPTAITGAMVQKPSGIPYTTGEISLRGNFAAATYHVKAKLKNPVAQQRVWVKAGQTHGVNLSTGVSIPQANNIQDFIISSVGGLALSGETALYIKSDSLIGFECIIVYPASTPNFTANCDASAAAVVPDYTVYKLSGAAPTSCANSQFVNANRVQWTGFANTTDAAPTLKMLHDSTKFYFCLTQTDGDLRSLTSANDDSGIFNDDRIEMLWRNTISTAVKDATTFKFVVNLLNAKWSANYPGDSSNIAQSLNESCTVTLTGDLDLTADDTNYQIFCSVDAGYTITDGLLISADAMVGDKDGTGNTKRIAKTAIDGQINNPVGWGIWNLSGTTVPAVTDSTPPTVGALSFVNVTATSVSAQSTVSDTGGASCCTITAKAGTATGTYASYSLGPFSGTLTAGIGTVALTGLTGGTSYRIRIRACDGAGNCTDSAEGTQATASSSTATHFSNNTVQGTGDCLSTSNAGLIKTCIDLASFTPGSRLELAAGTTTTPKIYAGANSMIMPLSGKSGTSGNPLTIYCAVPGGCLLDGQAARQPVYLFNNKWWVLEDFNAKNSGGGSVIFLSDNADNNIIRRVCAWDAPIAGNNNPFGGSNNTGNLLEDVCGFGIGRKIVGIYHMDNFTVRRAWGRWECSTAVQEPKLVYTIAYAGFGNIYENVIGTWKRDPATACVPPAPQHLYGILGSDRMSAGAEEANAKYLGSIAYLNTGDIVDFVQGAANLTQTVDDVEYRNIVLFQPGGFTTPRAVKFASFSPGCATTSDGVCNRELNNVTKVGWTAADSIINGTTSNYQSYASSTAMNAAGANPFQATTGTGARVCFRYVNGTLTSTKLWPWPMNQRIIDAMTQAGKPPVDVTATMEKYFGTIPSACK